MGRIRLDERARALYGVGAAVTVGEVVERVHPDDRERLSGELAAALPRAQ